MLDTDDCLARAQAYLDIEFAKPHFYEDIDTGEVRQHGLFPVEVVDHRVTPDHVLVAYHTVPDPLTGEREALCGAYPVTVDRRTGEVTEPDMDLLIEHWFDIVLPTHVSMWLREQPDPVVTIEPAGSLPDVIRIDAIRALKNGAGMSLLAAREAVEIMMSDGRTVLDLGLGAYDIREPKGQGTCLSLDRALAGAGVALRADGFAIAEYLDGRLPHKAAMVAR